MTSLAKIDDSSTDFFRQALADKVENESLDLPMLPEVARETLAMARDEKSDASALAKLIYRDQSLAAHLLQIANSAAYLGNNKIVSLQQAVARLGFRVISEITLAMVVKAQLFNVKGQEKTLAYLWQHALASGAWSREIARTLRYNVESAFLCGLLHEIGKPVTLQAIIDIGRKNDLTPNHEDLEVLMDEFHNPVGVMLATNWKLPEPVIESIAYYQSYEMATSFAKEAMIVHCSDAFTTTMIRDPKMDEEYLRNLPAIAELNLYPDDVTALIAKQDVVKETIEALSL